MLHRLSITLLLIYIHYSKPVRATTSPDKRYMLEGIWKKIQKVLIWSINGWHNSIIC